MNRLGLPDDAPNRPGEQRPAAGRSGSEHSIWLPTLAVEPVDGDAPADGGLTPGTRVGPYRIEDLLGRGGMGEVYRAEQLEPVRRTVALKLLPGLSTSTERIAWFAVETQLLARMAHPAIAQVYDAGSTLDGRYWFAMEYVRGTPLTRYCDERGLGLNQRIELFVRACLGVQHAHQKGVVHRDLKPDNILVAEVDGQPLPKIIDFGVAMSDRGSALPGVARVAGTPEYMSPEQLAPDAGGIDQRSDVHALGVILHELLIGERPAVNSGYQSRIAQSGAAAQPPSHRLESLTGDRLQALAQRQGLPARRLLGLLRRELDWVVLRATEPEREHRYPSVAALVDDLQRFLRNEPLAAAPSGPGYRLRKLAQRNRLALAAAGAVLLALIAGLGTAAWSYLQALAERDRARSALAQTEAVSRFLTDDLLGAADVETRADGASVTVREVLERARGTLSQRFADEPLVEASVRLALGGSLRGLGDRESARQEFARAHQLRRDELSADHAQTLEAAQRLASVIHQLGDFDAARVLYEDSLQRRRATLGRRHPQSIETLNSLGVLAWESGQHEQALIHTEEALALAESELGPRHRETLVATNNLARLRRTQGRIEDSEALFLRSIAGRIELFGEDSVMVQEARNDLAGLYRGSGRLDEAAALFEQVLLTNRRVAGPRHSSTIVAGNNLARTFGSQGRHAEAEVLLREALDSARVALPPRHWITGMLAMNLGATLTELGHYDEAGERLEEGLALLSAQFPDEDARVRSARGYLVELEQRRSGGAE